MDKQESTGDRGAAISALVMAACNVVFHWSPSHGRATIAEITFGDQLCRAPECHEGIEAAYGHLAAECNMSRSWVD